MSFFVPLSVVFYKQISVDQVVGNCVKGTFTNKHFLFALFTFLLDPYICRKNN